VVFLGEEGDKIILGSGVFPEWLESGEELRFGPTLTPHGQVSLTLQRKEDELALKVDASWFDQPPEMEVMVPGYKAKTITGFSGSYCFER
jgi:hypothetical protein